MPLETTPTRHGSRPRRIVAIDLPTFTADLARIRHHRRNPPVLGKRGPGKKAPGKGEAGVVLVFAERHGRRVVTDCCFRARDHGVRSAMTLAEALVLVRGETACRDSSSSADPIVAAADPARSLRALNRLAIRCLRFAPLAAVDGASGILLDIRGCERWLAPQGGESALLDRIERMFHRTGIGVRTAIADTVIAARAWAGWRPASASSTRHDDRRLPSEAIWAGLDPLPVECLELEPEIVDRLHQVNVRRVGELRRLPRASLPARYGPVVHRRLDQVVGRGGDAFTEARVTPVRQAERVLASRTFGGPVRSRETIELAVIGLIDDLRARLRSIGAGARIVRLTAERVDAPAWIDQVELARASRRPAHLWSVLEPLVERLPLDHGIDTLALEAARHRRLRDRSAPILSDPQAGEEDPHLEESFAAFIDLVQARFGPESIRRFDPAPGHAPEDRMRLMPCGHGSTDTETTRPDRIRQASTAAGPRPTTWLDHPEPIDVEVGIGPVTAAAGASDADSLEPLDHAVASSPLQPSHGSPISLHWRGRRREVAVAVGPETIGAPWWRRSGSGGSGEEVDREALPRRDYWSVRLEDGVSIWIFRASSSGRWFVQGLWA